MTDTKRQIDRFKEAAHSLECDESEAAFKRSLRMIAKAHVEKKPTKENG